MRDIVSNALTLGMNHDESEVANFLQTETAKHSTGQELLTAAAVNFKVNEADLLAEVQKFKHCNCKHGPLIEGPSEPKPSQNGLLKNAKIEVDQSDQAVRRQAHVDKNEWIISDDSPKKVSRFAQDVILHVVIHELGHALIREFDLPVLGNEECMADAFATHYLTTYLPDRALEVLKARTTSLMIEATEVLRAEWSVNGEHNNDARRAYQIAALAIAADPEKYISLAKDVGMSPEDIKNSKDYGAEIHRSWRRVLQPLWMPAGIDSNEVRITYDPDDDIISQLCSSELTAEIESIVRRFDWHSQISINLVSGEGGAGWSRSKRSINIYSEYIHRFIQQGSIAK